MSEIKTTFEPKDEEIFFSFKEDNGDIHEYCDEAIILAKLLIDGVLFIGEFNTGPFFESQKKLDDTLCVWVNCNDIFMWACADCESITTKELPELYKMHMADKKWGSVKWCCKKRNLQPQSPIVKVMKKENAWCELMQSLKNNPK